MPPAPSPRSNWLVSLILGVLRGIISLLQWLVTRLERYPSNPWGGVAVLGGAIALALSLTIVLNRLPLPVWLAQVLRPGQVVTVAQVPEALNSSNSSNSSNLNNSDTPQDALTGADGGLTSLSPNLPQANDPRPIANDPQGNLGNGIGGGVSETASATGEIIAKTTGETTGETTGQPLAPSLSPTEPSAQTAEQTAESPIGSPTTPTAIAPSTTDALDNIPMELNAPAAPIVVPDAPPPLTPEQRLLAALQERIADVELAYADSSIVAEVKVNFGANHLAVIVKERWYELSEREQDELAEEFRDRGEGFDFYDLAILDPQGNLVARPALVGSGVIVLRRSLS